MFKTNIYVDINENQIKIADIKKKKGTLQIKRLDKISIESIEDAGNLDNFVKNNKLKNKNINLILSNSKIITKTIEEHKIKIKDLDKLLKNTISGNFITVDSNLYFFDYRIINTIKKEGKEYYELLLIAVPKEEVYKAAKICQDLKLKVDRIEVYANSLLDTYKSTEKETCVVDLSEQQIQFISLNKTSLFMYANFDSKEQEDYMFNNETSEEKIHIENITNSITDYLNFFSIKHYGERIRNMYVFGENSLVENFEQSIKNVYEGEVYKNDFKTKITLSSKANKEQGLYEYLSIVGFAKQDKEVKGINFKKHIETAEDKIKVAIITLGILTSLFIVVTLGYPLLTQMQNQLEIKQLEEQINSLNEVSVLYEEYEGTIRKVKEKQRTVKDINNYALDIIKVIDTMKSLNSETIVYNNISIQSDGKINITFSVPKTMDSANLIDSLIKLDVFEDVFIDSVRINDTKQDLNFILQIRKDKIKLFKFEQER